MSILIRGKQVNYCFRSLFLKMSKSVYFSVSPPESADSSSSEDIVEIITKIKALIPDLTSENHKGSCGRIGIVGGSAEYTGAPFFAGIAAMKLGADLVHIFCCKDAAIPIKSYSPELMVHPILDASDMIKAIEPWIQKLHALVIGPGLGRSPVSMRSASEIITFCKDKKKPPIPLILDADAIHLLHENPDILKNYKGPLILTPNAHEYTKLATKVAVGSSHDLAAYFNAIIVKKGPRDLIHNGMMSKMFTSPPGETTLVCDVPGSHRRCGGQGDLLAGFIATFAAWHEITLKSQNLSIDLEVDLSSEGKVKECKYYLRGFSYAAYGGCLMAKTCSNLGFKEYGRSMTTSDMIRLIGKVFVICFDH